MRTIKFDPSKLSDDDLRAVMYIIAKAKRRSLVIEKRMMSVQEVSEAYGLGAAYIRRLIRTKRLNAKKDGRSYLVSHAAMRSYLRKKKAKGREPKSEQL